MAVVVQLCRFEHGRLHTSGLERIKGIQRVISLNICLEGRWARMFEYFRIFELICWRRTNILNIFVNIFPRYFGKVVKMLKSA